MRSPNGRPKGVKMIPKLPKSLGGPRLLWSTSELAAALGISRRQVFWLLKKYPERFGPPRYGRRGRHPRLHRLLDSNEAHALASLLTKATYGSNALLVYPKWFVRYRELIEGVSAGKAHGGRKSRGA